MKAEEWFDSESGLHDEKLLLPAVQESIRAYQEIIQIEVDKKNPGQYRPTSGWRSDSGNRVVGGVPDSAHLWGGARDFVRLDGANIPPTVCSKLFGVLMSSGCWHVYIRR